jgi:hypothetical protein
MTASVDDSCSSEDDQNVHRLQFQSLTIASAILPQLTWTMWKKMMMVSTKTLIKVVVQLWNVKMSIYRYLIVDVVRPRTRPRLILTSC